MLSSSIKHYCEKCTGETNHKICHETKVEGDPEAWDYLILYQIVECLGCEKVSFRSYFEDRDIHHEEYEPEVDRYPSVLVGRRILPDHGYLPIAIRFLYDESIKALKEGCFMLASAGFRAIIEAVCLNKGISTQNLKFRIDQLCKKGHITKLENKRLHAIRFLGNDSIHDMKIPNESTLFEALDILENLLMNLYFFEKNYNTGLDIMIDEYEEFSKLLKSKLSDFSTNSEHTLETYLGKDLRRIDSIQGLKIALIDEINTGKFKYLSIGKTEENKDGKGQSQFFIRSEEEIDFWDLI